MDRGSQYLGYDFWWHITQDTLLTSEWGTPNQIENGVIPEELLQGRYGHQVHVWDLRKRRHVQALDLGKIPDGSRNAPRARSHQDIWICGCRRLAQRSEP